MHILFVSILLILASVKNVASLKCYYCAGSLESDCYEGIKSAMVIQDCNAGQRNISTAKLSISDHGILEDKDNTEVVTTCISYVAHTYGMVYIERGCGYIYEGLDICDYMDTYFECAEKFPNRQHPTHSTFTALHQRLRETGSVVPKQNETGRHNDVTAEHEDVILMEVEENPEISVRRLSAMYPTISKSSVGNILHKENLYPFHFTKVQAQLEEDFPAGVEFARWLQNQKNQDEDFFRPNHLFLLQINDGSEEELMSKILFLTDYEKF
ncbi:Helix-turn-helix domain (DUF4817) [Popillia japonica]|uniref:Helix-turn-helix domain (DUF4817) n=1 Tax=Popillia japonica TaxID=7064 RepID=A0AAW1KF52_POPJA